VNDVFRFLLPVALFLAALGHSHAAAGDACFEDWASALPVIRKEKLVTIEELSPLALQKGAGDILKSALCMEKGRYVYRLVVREQSGKLKNLVVDARAPFER
jgi:uncharacterized membrane protein YkoI